MYLLRTRTYILERETYTRHFKIELERIEEFNFLDTIGSRIRDFVRDTNNDKAEIDCNNDKVIVVYHRKGKNEFESFTTFEIFNPRKAKTFINKYL